MYLRWSILRATFPLCRIFVGKWPRSEGGALGYMAACKGKVDPTENENKRQYPPSVIIPLISVQTTCDAGGPCLRSKLSSRAAVPDGPIRGRPHIVTTGRSRNNA